MSATAQPRRSQQQRREATIAALLAAARERFARDGYAATSLEAVASAAGVTKGALYHHFEGKDALFATVFDIEQRRLCAIAQAALPGGLEAACLAWLDASLDRAVQRITLVDAPLALSATTLRSTAMLGLIERALADRGHPGDVRALAQLLHGALREAALTLADDRTRRDAVTGELRGLLRA